MTAQRWPHKQEVSQSFSTGRCLSFHALSAVGCNLSFLFPSFRVPVHLPSTVSVQFLTIFLLDLSSPFPPEPLALALPAAICPTHPLSLSSSSSSSALTRSVSSAKVLGQTISLSGEAAAS